jgi:hypothetical protein
MRSTADHETTHPLIEGGGREMGGDQLMIGETGPRQITNL